MQRRYRHVIWDWNGTLLDDVELSIDVMSGMLERRGMPRLDRNRYQAVFDFPVRDYYVRLGLDGSEASFRQLSAEFISGYDARRFEPRLHANCEASLAAVRTAGMTQSILSAYRHETLCEVVEHYGLTQWFVALNGLDNIYAHSKTESGRRALAALQLRAADVILIGDTLHDLEVATDLGVDCLLVAHGHHPAGRLRDRHAHVHDDLAGTAEALGLTLPRVAQSAAEIVDRGSPGGSGWRPANQ